VTDPDNDTIVGMYTTMSRIVCCDDAIRAGLSAGRFAFSYYSPRGQEAIAAGWGAATEPTDMLVTTYRGMHDQVAKGVALRPLFAEMLGRATGTNGGKGGPMHIVDPDRGLMLTTGVVGSGLPIANGLAWASQLSDEPKVTVCCFGDGATNIGAFHEAMNLASVWQLPVIFLCQNNRYGEHTAIADHQKNANVADRAASYATKGVTIDGNDPIAVYAAVAEAASGARSGDGPTLVEAVTYRLYGHVFGDPMGYVDKSELDAAWSSEPTGRFRKHLLDLGVLSARDLDEIDAANGAEVTEALDLAANDPEPDPEVIGTDVTGALR
jgi:acetoin:2,6-dichlorophenolindophenol oxidoreductase subunit alpha